MRVFISWSGEMGAALGSVLSEWLPKALQSIRPYFSPSDTEKGSRWASEILRELEDCKYCIVITTRESLNSKWVYYEAGAISSKAQSRLHPLLFGLDQVDVVPPLSLSNCTVFDREDFKKLMSSLNSGLGEQSLLPDQFDEVFSVWWPRLEKQVQEVMAKYGEKAQSIVVRNDRDVMDEILVTVRDLKSNIEVIDKKVGPSKAFFKAIDMALETFSKIDSSHARDDLLVLLDEYLVGTYRIMELVGQSEVVKAKMRRLVDLRSKIEALSDEIPF